MKKINYLLLIIVTLALTGCFAFHVPTFIPTVHATNTIQQTIARKVAVGTFTMTGEKDAQTFYCRGAPVRLPNNMTYSQYIKHAFAQQLTFAERYASTPQSARHTLSADISAADFSSIHGHWTIIGNVKVDNYQAITINSQMKFSSSFIGVSACIRSAKAFANAVQQFVNKTLSNPEIVRELNR